MRFKALEDKCRRSVQLEKILQMFINNPISTSSERTFSVASTFATKLQNRMESELLNRITNFKISFSAKSKLKNAIHNILMN